MPNAAWTRAGGEAGLHKAMPLCSRRSSLTSFSTCRQLERDEGYSLRKGGVQLKLPSKIIVLGLCTIPQLWILSYQNGLGQEAELYARDFDVGPVPDGWEDFTQGFVGGPSEEGLDVGQDGLFEVFLLIH